MAKQPAKGRKTPAKPRKATQSKAAIPESVAAVEPVVDAIPPEVHAPEVLETLELVEPVEVESVPVVDETPVPDVEKVSAEPVETPAPAKAPEQSSSTGFLPLLLGGVLAGVVGISGRVGRSGSPSLLFTWNGSPSFPRKGGCRSA